MQLLEPKAQEQGGRMRRILTDHGFTKVDSAERHEVWRLGVHQVVLTLVDSLHDPVEAEVSHGTSTNVAYNAKGLSILLQEVR
jgi:hypothetical protein